MKLPSLHQRLPYPPLTRTQILHRRFKRAILLATLAFIAAVFALSPRLRFLVIDTADRLKRDTIHRLTGLEPTQAEINAARNLRRTETERNTRASLTKYYNDLAPPEMRAMFDAAAMNPTDGLIGVGRANNGFLLSSDVFAPDPARSYRFLPNTASVWLRQVTLIGGPFGLFLVHDTPEVRAAAGAAGAIVDETSRQTTNSLGLRGPEPDPNAELRGIVLGDSFMQGMFNNDDHTPPLDLERELSRLTGQNVSILNTGHIGYAPEQYLRTLEDFGPRFNPHFVVTSVCPNDFGDENDVMEGRADDLDEAAHWLDEISAWCRARNIPHLVVIVPIDRQILTRRRPARYPDPLIDRLNGPSAHVLDPFEAFNDEHLRLRRESPSPAGQSLLYNGHIHDNHFSPLGSHLWAEQVARRLLFLLPEQSPVVQDD